MFAKLFLAGGLAMALTANSGQASAEDWEPKGHDSAVAACLDRNDYKPAELDAASDDGLGDFLVWVKDKDGDLWLCNADEEGEVYANVLLNGDLLDGDGAELVAKGAESGHKPGPAESAERLCAAVGDYMEDLEIVATVDDALGDYLVWLKNGDDSYWMCNASSDAKLYAFEPVHYPLDASEGDTDVTCCEQPEDRRS